MSSALYPFIPKNNLSFMLLLFRNKDDCILELEHENYETVISPCDNFYWQCILFYFTLDLLYFGSPYNNPIQNSLFPNIYNISLRRVAKCITFSLIS